MWFPFLILVASVIGSSHAILYGVSEWWKVNEAKDEDTSRRLKGRALLLVCAGLFAWSVATIYVSSMATAITTVQILDAAGVDVSKLTEEQ